MENILGSFADIICFIGCKAMFGVLQLVSSCRTDLISNYGTHAFKFFALQSECPMARSTESRRVPGSMYWLCTKYCLEVGESMEGILVDDCP